MVDNVAITAGSGTTIRTDQVGSVHYQVVKLDAGGDGVSVPITAGQQLANASLPVVLASDAAITVNVSGVSGSVAVSGPLTDAQLRASAVNVSAASLPLPSGAAAEATLQAIGALLSGTLTVDGNVTANGTVAVSAVSGNVAITAASLPLPSGAATQATLAAINTTLAGTLTVAVSGVSGNVAITAASLPLPSGAATAAKQPALGTAGSASADVLSVQGIASMTALKVDGSAVTQPVNGTVSVSGNVAVTGPLTDAQLRASAVNVSSAAAASELHLGEVGGNATVVKIAGSTVGANNTTYTTGDLLGTKMNLTGALRVANGTGLVHSLTIQDLSKQNAPLDLILFDSDPSGTTFTNNSALDVADADITRIIGTISVLAGDYVSFADNAVACLKNLGIVVKGADATTSLYAAMVIRNSTANFTNNELSVAVGILRD